VEEGNLIEANLTANNSTTHIPVEQLIPVNISEPSH
jgi:hypothetical protein